MSIVSITFDVVMATIKFHADLTKISFFEKLPKFFSTFLHQITEIREFVHFTSILA